MYGRFLFGVNYNSKDAYPQLTKKSGCPTSRSDNHISLEVV